MTTKALPDLDSHRYAAGTKTRRDRATMPEYFDKSDVDFAGLTDLAGRILEAQVAEDDAAVENLFTELRRANPEVGIQLAIIVWIDSVATYVGWRRLVKLGGAPDLSLIDSETGELLTTENMEPASQWAVNLIMARITRDEDAFYAHMGEADGRSLGWVYYLLTLLAANLAGYREQQRIAASN